MDEFSDAGHEWSPETEWSPFFLMFRGADMDASLKEYWERQRDDEDTPGWGLPQVWE